MNTKVTEQIIHKLALGVLLLLPIVFIAAVYWPARHANFVWDDIEDFQRMAWLRHGSDWGHLLFRDFNNWTNYFRPLVVALFTVEIRLFGGQPGPMHVTSLLIHLINTIMVGILATDLTHPARNEPRHWLWAPIPMLLYGLHPALVEPVVWIGCQFDLVATFFMLLGLLLNVRVKTPVRQTLGVTICFFLAACSKESAAAFPAIVVIFDWLHKKEAKNAFFLTAAKNLLRKNATKYAWLAVAGLLYLGARRWALGGLNIQSDTDQLTIFAHFQQSCFLYLQYWRIFFWPMKGMGPLHPVSPDLFMNASTSSLATDAVAIVIAIAGAILTLRRRYAGALIAVVTLALMPVLHIAPGNFDESLYQERYAMTALALACVLMPSVWKEIPLSIDAFPMATRMTLFAALAWIALCAVSVRSIIPLWSSQLNLWTWANEEHPDYATVKDELITAYIDAGEYVKAQQLIDTVVSKNIQCLNCLLNGANLALIENDAQKASFLLKKAESIPNPQGDKSTYRFYLTTRSKLLLLKNKPTEAEHIARQAIEMDDLDAEPQLTLAIALALQGKYAEAESAERAAIPLLPPEERSHRYQSFEQLVTKLRTSIQ